MKTKCIIILLSIIFMTFAYSCAEISSDDEPVVVVPDPEPDPKPDPKPDKDGEVITEGAVDLGLSVKWAACNLGTTACYDLGKTYQWGDQRKDCLLDICGTEYDQATVELGNGWRLPTKEQAQELLDKCRWHPTTYRGENGVIVTGPSNNAIFMRCENRDSYSYFEYWIGICDVNTNYAYSFYDRRYYFSDLHPKISTSSRTDKRYIRPVYVGSKQI